MSPPRAAAWLLLGCGLLAGCSGRPLHRGGPTRAVAPAPAAGATAALLREADAAASRGDTERGAALLERAVRIAPQDPLPWSRLAELRLDQGQGGQAQQLALKSNRLAEDDPALRARNWRLIARARRSSGDPAGAREAEAQAERASGR